MDKILVVAYYTPPLGLSGVMRVTKLCKFLPESGWQPVILTVQPVLYYAYDSILLDDLKGSIIFRTESLDPNRLLYKFKGSKTQEFREFKISRSSLNFPYKLLKLLFLPDAKIGWLPFALSTGKKVIQKLKPRAIFATAPPWTALLIGAQLAYAHQLPFIADFRDPWPTGFQPPPSYQRPLLRNMLKKIISRASLITAVNQGTARQIFSTLSHQPSTVNHQVEILENGFDPDEFIVPPEKLAGFSLLYVGNLYENQEEIADFLSALAQIPDVRFYLAGAVDKLSQALLEANPQVTLIGTVPHSRAIALMKGADALLYLGKPNQPVGLKLYEYLGAQKPILVWGDENEEAAKLILECNAGFVCKDEKGLATALQEIRKNPEQFQGGDRRRFDRRLQAELLVRRL
ncbi:MAG: glycosyltransferase, partial [candidate division WOR-3 bacterium]